MIVSKSSGSDIEPVPAGLHPAILIWQVDIGSQENKKFNNWQRKVMLTWEIPGERIETEKGNQPRVITKTYTASLSEKSHLYTDMVSWRGKSFSEQELQGFDLATALGRQCQINVVHADVNGKTYANVATILPYKGPMMKPENPVIGYDIEVHGLRIPENLPEWIQKKIMESPEYKALTNATTSELDGSTENPGCDDGENVPAIDQDIPF